MKALALNTFKDSVAETIKVTALSAVRGSEVSDGNIKNICKSMKALSIPDFYYLVTIRNLSVNWSLNL